MCFVTVCRLKSSRVSVCGGNGSHSDLCCLTCWLAGRWAGWTQTVALSEIGIHRSFLRRHSRCPCYRQYACAPALFAFRNKINPIGAGNIWRGAKTLVPWKLPYCRVMLRFGVEQRVSYYATDCWLKYDLARVVISVHTSVSQFTLDLLCQSHSNAAVGRKSCSLLLSQKDPVSTLSSVTIYPDWCVSGEAIP